MPDPVNRDAALPVDGRWPLRLPWRSRCTGCGGAGCEAMDLCPACRALLPWCGIRLAHAPPPLGTAIAAFRYAPPLDHWLPRFKFHRDLAAGRLLSALMVPVVAGADRPQALVPIPLHRARLRQRGYDQALELARPVARALRMPLCADRLVRIRATAPQSELDADARGRNLRGAFAVRPGPALPAHVALVDDVMTTGATLQAAASALRDAGVGRVDAWVCARVV